MPPARWVICKLCGTQFDVNKKGGYYDGRRYICKRCAKLIKKQQISESFTGEPENDSYNNIYREKPKSWFSKNWKVVIGIFLLFGGLGNIGKDWDTVLFGVLLGSLLIFFQYYPIIKAKKQEKDRFKAEQLAISEKVSICKYCGAKTKGTTCEYCGMILE